MEERKEQEPFSLSRYFPEGTEYFYGYPSGEDSHFYNIVPPAVEELVSARPLSCAGPNVTTLVFQNAAAPSELAMLRTQRMHLADGEQIKLLEGVPTHLIGAERNAALKDALQRTVTPGTLVMAQPFLDREVESLYRIPPHLSVWLNDKKNMPAYIPEEFLPRRMHTFPNGQAFAAHAADTSTPCVVKISSSSSGDGVRLCRTPADLAQARHDLRGTNVSVIVEQYVSAVKNLGVQFGIPHDPARPMEVVGIDEQLTDDAGSFLGGLVDSGASYAGFERVRETLLSTILPRIRAMGWYGPGGFDVLLDEQGNYSFVDANFRMTGMTNCIYAAANGEIPGVLAGFTATLRATEDVFRQRILQRNTFAPSLYLIGIARREQEWHFQGAIFAQHRADLAAVAQQLLNEGVQSRSLSAVAASLRQVAPVRAGMEVIKQPTFA